MSGNSLKRTISSKILTLDSINQNVVKMEFIARSPTLIRAAEIQKEIKQASIHPNEH